MMATSARTIGTLFVIATPIGNRDDITIRALETLKSVDTILAEDTRHSMQLLTFYGIKKPLISWHAHNEGNKAQSIITALLEGKSFALISDAGTPLISDPGYPLVNLARAHHIDVTPIPGACAFITALSAAGVPCDAVSFFGFLPAKATARRAKLTTLKSMPHTVIFYESTHRIQECLEDIATVFGETCQLVLAKELTKTYERFISGSTIDVRNWLLEDLAHCKGEFVVIIPPRELESVVNYSTETLTILLNELPLKQAVKLAALITGEPKNELYKTALGIGKTIPKL
ncbi:MAG: 16S rRNA (cytidine(1402)-2'-O)-methyltransferase [Legionellaceae bacterium]|nr:16S rRNA (cytidine(1402)-2'-O)-methyltransferase [Legionellaceae bacterium]